MRSRIALLENHATGRPYSALKIRTQSHDLMRRKLPQQGCLFERQFGRRCAARSAGFRPTVQKILLRPFDSAINVGKATARQVNETLGGFASIRLCIPRSCWRMALIGRLVQYDHTTFQWSAVIEVGDIIIDESNTARQCALRGRRVGAVN
jgi:hypothetical protein